MAEHVYHWKHGWIPLDHTAALSKAKGNHDLAAKYLSDAHGPSGIRSRKDVASALLDIKSVPAADRPAALRHVASAAHAHNATDLLPGHPKAAEGVTAPGSWTTHQMPDGTIQIRSKNGADLGRVRQVKAGRHAGQWEARAEGRHGADYGDSPEKVIDALYDSYHGKPGEAAMARSGGSPEEQRRAATRAYFAAQRNKG